VHLHLSAGVRDEVLQGAQPEVALLRARLEHRRIEAAAVVGDLQHDAVAVRAQADPQMLGARVLLGVAQGLAVEGVARVDLCSN